MRQAEDQAEQEGEGGDTNFEGHRGAPACDYSLSSRISWWRLAWLRLDGVTSLSDTPRALGDLILVMLPGPPLIQVLQRVRRRAVVVWEAEAPRRV
jgi:hypothetical protein